MAFQSKTLDCLACGTKFNFTVDEQEFFAARGLTNEPKRCPDCRVLARLERQGKSEQLATEVTCAECGKTAHVPFRPRGDKPVYCIYCFKVKKSDDSSKLVV